MFQVAGLISGDTWSPGPHRTLDLQLGRRGRAWKLCLFPHNGRQAAEIDGGDLLKLLYQSKDLCGIKGFKILVLLNPQIANQAVLMSDIFTN